jgi:hypothetical protein
MAMIQILNDKSLMPFGKHKGKAMEDVPAGYLLWYMEQPAQDCPGRGTVKGVTFDGVLGSHIYDNDHAVRAYIEDNMDVLKMQAKLERNAKRNTLFNPYQ